MGLQKTAVASHKAWAPRFRLQEACPGALSCNTSSQRPERQSAFQVPESEVSYLGGLMLSPTHMAELAATTAPVFQLVFQGAFINL